MIRLLILRDYKYIMKIIYKVPANAVTEFCRVLLSAIRLPRSATVKSKSNSFIWILISA